MQLDQTGTYIRRNLSWFYLVYYFSDAGYNLGLQRRNRYIRESKEAD